MSRAHYPILTIEGFQEYMVDNMLNFVGNMENLDAGPYSVPVWMEMMCAWMEVGTDEEEEMYGG